MKKYRVGIICSIETVAVFRNRSRRQDPLKLRLSDPVLFLEKDRGNILRFYPTASQQIGKRLPLDTVRVCF